MIHVLKFVYFLIPLHSICAEEEDITLAKWNGWKKDVDTQLIGTGFVSRACIAGIDGVVYGRTEDFNPSRKEIWKFINEFYNHKKLKSDGIVLEGQHYEYISSSNRVLRGKLGNVGLLCAKATQVIILAIYDQPIQQEEAESAVEKLQDYLITAGY